MLRVPDESSPPPRIVEPLPDSKIATSTRLPSALTAMARGSSPSMSITLGAAARFAGSKTSTSLVCEQDTKARRGVPAKTTSQGSSLVSRVARTWPLVRSTTLIESETWFTTQASSSVLARTETGSTPTGIAMIGVGVEPLTSRTSRTPSAVLTASRRCPSGVRSRGETWGVSKLTKACWGGVGAAARSEASVEISIGRSARRERRAPASIAQVLGSWNARRPAWFRFGPDSGFVTARGAALASPDGPAPSRSAQITSSRVR